MASNYRLIICFDISAESLIEAYGKLVTGLKGVDVAWETSDEWYTDENMDNEEDEAPGDVGVLLSTITQYYQDNPHKDAG